MIAELENMLADLPKLPNMVTDSVLIPLFRQNTLKLNDLSWYNEEDKDLLFDVSGQFKIAALLLDFMLKECNKAQPMLKDEFKRDHDAAFKFLASVIDESDKSSLQDNFLEESISAPNRDFIADVLGLK